MDGSADRIGIGTSTPGAEKLEIMDGFAVFDSTSPYDVLIHGYDSDDDGVLDLLANNSVTVQLHANGDSYFLGGGLGIGTTTACGISIGSAVPDTTCAGDNDLYVEGTFEVDGASNIDGAVNIAGVLTQVGNANFTTGDVTMGNTDFVFDASANAVGLGTTTPQATLHVGDALTSHTMSTDDVFFEADLEVDGTLYVDTGTILVGDVTMDTPDFVFDSSASMVGLGPTTPTATLTVGDAVPGHGVTSNDVFFGGDLELDGTLYLDGPIVYDTGSITATTTLTAASDNIQFLAASANMTTVTLPAVTDGLRFSFHVTGSLTGSTTRIYSPEGTNIEGALIVGGAVVECDNETYINFITDGENIGDYVELISDGTNWLIIDSGGLTASKLTCTTS